MSEKANKFREVVLIFGDTLKAVGIFTRGKSSSEVVKRHFTRRVKKVKP